MLFCLRSLMPGKEWVDKPIAVGFWGLNIGLLMMCLLSLLPLGLTQAWASITHGFWYARSSDFLYSPALTVLRWLRTPGDIVFTVGGLAIGVFMVGLLFGWSVRTSGGEQVSGSVFNRLEDREDEADAVGADAAVRE